MESRNTNDTFEIEGRIDAQLHNVDALRSEVDDWDDLSDYQKSLVVRPLERIDHDSLDPENEKYAYIEVEPAEEVVEYNTTCVSLHEYIVDELDPNQTVDEQASHLALGIDSTTPSSADTALSNEVFRKSITDHADNGTELLASTFISSEEANGNDLQELGLFTDDGTGNDYLLNHSTFAAVTKDDTKTVTFDVTLSFSAA